MSITALMYVIRSRATTHDGDRKYCCKHFPHFDRCNSVSFLPCLRKEGRRQQSALKNLTILGGRVKRIPVKKKRRLRKKVYKQVRPFVGLTALLP